MQDSGGASASSTRACHEKVENLKESIRKEKRIFWGYGIIPLEESDLNNNCNSMVGETAAGAVGELEYHSNDSFMVVTIFIGFTQNFALRFNF